MLETLGGYLEPGENIIAAVYCIYKQTGFLASNMNMRPGYAAITDKNRFIGHKMNMAGFVPVNMDMNYLTKVKVSKALLGNWDVHLVFQQNKKQEIKIQISPKILTSKFPEQQQNCDTMLSELRAMQERLS